MNIVRLACVATLFVMILEITGCGGGGNSSSVRFGGNGIDANTSYSVSHLAKLPGKESSTAVDVNDSGEIVGTYQDSDNNEGVCFWDASGNVTSLPPLPGFDQCRVEALNNMGYAIGYSFLRNDGSEHGCVWLPDGAVRALEGTPDYPYSHPCDLNDSGQIVGSCSSSTRNTWQPCVWDLNGRVTLLPTGAGDIGATAACVNNEGLIVGVTSASIYSGRACYWSQDKQLHILALPPRAEFSIAYRVNNQGVILGAVRCEDQAAILGNICLWGSDGTLLAMSSERFEYPPAFNDYNQFVGFSYTTAYLFYGINSSKSLSVQQGYRAPAAYGMNNSGVIVGSLYDPNDTYNAVVWRPVQ